MDPEIEAMSQIASALQPLDQDAQRRVLKWVIERYQLQASSGKGGLPAIASPPALDSAATPLALATSAQAFQDLHSLFDAANPETGTERALVVGYWHQQQSNEDWDSQAVNSDLKHLGYPSANITRDLDGLMSRSPRLVIQTRKEGTTKQARKKYKLTREGMKAVELMLSRPVDR
jgi:hypothetical protein